MAQGSRGTVAIETHGCKLNLADSEALAVRFTRLGYTVVEPGEPADIHIVNSCTVTQTADRKARQALRSAHRRDQDALVVATGCYAQRAPQELAQIRGVGLVLGNSRKAELVEEVLRLRGEDAVPCVVEQVVKSSRLPRRTRAFVKIQEGCNQVCAYCIVPKVRGRERSVPAETLVQEVQERVQEGYQEVVLTGTQLGSYGFDLQGATLPGLLARILAETEVPRLRVSSLQPQEITLELLRLWVEEPRLCPHFHMPLQSGSWDVLRRMRRRYTPGLYAATVGLIRDAVPHAAITTDVIVGFPGETEAAFCESLGFCEATGFAAMHVFPYSVRPGTSAAYFTETVDPDNRKRRMEEMLSMAARLSDAHRRCCVGQVRPVLWEEMKQVSGVPVWTGLADTYLRVSACSFADLTNRITLTEITHVAEETAWSKVVA